MNYLEIKADKSSIRIGERVTLRIKAPAGGELVLPFKTGEAALSGLVIISSPERRGEEIVLDVTSYKAGDLQIPSFQIKAGDVTLFETVSLNIKVEGNTSELKLIDIKPPVEIPLPLTYYLGVAAIILLVLFFAYSIYKKFLGAKNKKVKAPGAVREIISPFDKAMRDLNDIQARQAEPGSMKEILFRVTEVLKRFIQEEHGIDVMDLTSTELVETLHGNQKFDTSLVNDLAGYFKDSDFIKFAGREGGEAVSLYIEKAKSFVSLLRKPERPGTSVPGTEVKGHEI